MADPDFQAKAPRYKTAIATVGCSQFRAGAYVSVRYLNADSSGTHWFEIKGHDKGPCSPPVRYPHSHLKDFVI